MEEKTGQIFSITKDNPPVAGCTVSKSIYSKNGYDFTYFSLAECTDIAFNIRIIENKIITA